MLVKKVSGVFGFDAGDARPALRSGSLSEKAISVEIQNQSGISLGVCTVKIGEPLPAVEDEVGFQLVADPTQLQTWLIDKGHELVFTPSVDSLTSHGVSEVVVVLKEATSGTGQNTGGSGSGDGGGDGDGDGGGSGGGSGGDHFGDGTGPIADRPVITKQPELAHMNGMVTIACDYIKGNSIIWYARDLMKPKEGWVVASAITGWNTKTLTFDPNDHDYLEFRAIVSNDKNATANTNSIKVMISPRLIVDRLSGIIVPNVDATFVFKVQNANEAVPRITTQTGVPVDVATVTKVVLSSIAVSYTVVIPYNDSTNGKTYLFTVEQSGQIQSVQVSLPWLMKIISSDVSAPNNSALRLELQTGENSPKRIRWVNVRKDGTRLSILTTTNEAVHIINFPIEHVSYWIQGEIEVEGFGVIDKTRIFDLNTIVTPSIGEAANGVLTTEQGQHFTLHGVIGSPITFRLTEDGTKVDDVYNTTLGGDVTLALEPIDGRVKNNDVLSAHYEVEGNRALTATNSTWKYYEYPKVGMMQFPNIGVTRLAITSIGYFQEMTVRCGTVSQSYTDKNSDVYNLDIVSPVADTPIVINTTNGIKHANITTTLLLRPEISYITNITQTVANNTITCQVHNQTDNTPIITYKWYLATDPTHVLTTNSECSLPADHAGEIIVCETAIGMITTISMATHKLSDLDGAYFIRNLYMVRDVSTPEQVELKWQAAKYKSGVIQRNDPKVTPEAWVPIISFSDDAPLTSQVLSLHLNEDCKYRIALTDSSGVVTLSDIVIINEKGGITWSKSSGIITSVDSIHSYHSKLADYRTEFGIAYVLEDLQNADSLEFDLVSVENTDYTPTLIGNSDQGNITINGIETGNSAQIGTVYTEWNVQNKVAITPPYAVADVAWSIPRFISQYSIPQYFGWMQQVIYGRGGEVNRLNFPVDLARIQPLPPFPLLPGLVIKLQADASVGADNITSIHWQTASDLFGTKGWTDRLDITTLDAEIPYTVDNKNRFYRPVVKTSTFTYYGYPLAIYDNADYPVLPDAIPSVLSGYGDCEIVSLVSSIGSSIEDGKRPVNFTNAKFYWTCGFDVADPWLDMKTACTNLLDPVRQTWIRNPDLLLAVTDTPELVMSRKKWDALIYSNAGNSSSSPVSAIIDKGFVYLTAQVGSRWFTIATIPVATLDVGDALTFIVEPITEDTSKLKFDLGTHEDVTAEDGAVTLTLAWYNVHTKHSTRCIPGEFNELFSNLYADVLTRTDGNVEQPFVVATSAWSAKYLTDRGLSITAMYRSNGAGLTSNINGGRDTAHGNEVIQSITPTVLPKQRDSIFVLAGPLPGQEGTPNARWGSAKSQDLSSVNLASGTTVMDNMCTFGFQTGFTNAIAYQLVNTEHAWESNIFVSEQSTVIDFRGTHVGDYSSANAFFCTIPFQLRCNTFPVTTPNLVSKYAATFPVAGEEPYCKARKSWLTGWDMRIWCYDIVDDTWTNGSMLFKDQFLLTNNYVSSNNPIIGPVRSEFTTQLRKPTFEFPGLDDRRVVVTSNRPEVIEVDAVALSDHNIQLTIQPRADKVPVTFRSEIIDSRNLNAPLVLTDTVLADKPIRLVTDILPVKSDNNIFDITVRYCIKSATGWSQWLTKVITLMPAVVTEPPVITTQPVNLLSARTGAFKCKIIVDGNGGVVSYKWMINSNHVIGNSSECLITTEMLKDETLFPNDMLGYCDVSNGFKTIRSDVFTLTVDPELPPTITKQPNSITIIDRNVAATPITITGHGDDPTSYKWYERGENGSFRLYRETKIGELALLPVELNRHEHFKTGVTTWHVDVVDKDGATSSDTFTIYIIQPPEVNPLKVNYTVTAITPAEMEVNIGNTNGTVTYEWATTFGNTTKKVWDSVTNTCTVTLEQLNAIYPIGNCKTTCKVTNEAGATTSAPITITRVQAPTFTAQPDKEYVMSRTGSLLITVGTTGISDHSQIEYHIHSHTFTSANIGTLELTADTIKDWPSKVSGTVILTNDSGTATSNEFTISILSPLVITTQMHPLVIRTNKINSAALTVTVDDQLHPCTYNWHGKNGSVVDTYNAQGTDTLIFTPAQLQTLPTLSGSGTDVSTSIACEITRTIDGASLMALGTILCDYHDLPIFTTQPASVVIPDRTATLPSITCALSNEPNMAGAEYDWMYDKDGKEHTLAITTIPTLSLTGLLDRLPDGVTNCRIKIVHKQMVEVTSRDFTITITGDHPVITVPPQNITVTDRNKNAPEIKFEISGDPRDYQFQWFVKVNGKFKSLKYTHEPSLILTPYDIRTNPWFPRGEVIMNCNCKRRDGSVVDTPEFKVTFLTPPHVNTTLKGEVGNLSLIQVKDDDGINFTVGTTTPVLTFSDYVAGASISCTLKGDTELFAVQMNENGTFTIPTTVILESAIKLDASSQPHECTFTLSAPSCASDVISKKLALFSGKPALLNAVPDNITITSRSDATTPITGVVFNKWYAHSGMTTTTSLSTTTLGRNYTSALSGGMNPTITTDQLGDIGLLPDGTTSCTLVYTTNVTVGDEVTTHLQVISDAFTITIINPLTPTVITEPSALTTVDLSVPAALSIPFVVDGKNLPIAYKWFMQRKNMPDNTDDVNFIECPLGGSEASPLIITVEELTDVKIFPIGCTVNLYCGAVTNQGTVASKVGQLVITNTNPAK